VRYNGYFFASQPNRLRPNLAAHSLPFGVVPILDTSDRMGDLVQDGVPHFVFVVQSDKVTGKLDGLCSASPQMRPQAG
jgi:hypothetical protein